MPSGQKPGQATDSIGLRPGSSLDTRQDLGYGRATKKFHGARTKGAVYPYSEPAEDLEGVDLDLEIDVLQKILNKVQTPYQSDDELIGRSIDHTAKVSGNTPINPVPLGEIAAAKGMVPFPTMYKKRIQVGGGVNSPMAIRPGQAVRTGTTQGWSRAPEEIGGPEGVNVTFDEYQDGEDETLTKVRKVIRGILDQQEDARNDV